MNTHNVKTAAPESSERCDVTRLTIPQLTDLFVYVMASSGTQKQPAFFVPPLRGDINVAVSQDGSETIIVWTLDSWPVAAAVPEAGFLAVLTGNEL